ncbi:MAG: DNA methylase [Desulfovibrio sp. S3730MH75]|nr:MAG: DNA methylase [Desulfovibrio sp. S3730MH75]
MQTAIENLYSKPFPSSRIGPLYNAFSYPTKISPEAIAVFIATHTDPGATVLDAFGGSGTTGLATLLCDRPTDSMCEMARELGVEPQWGPRKAHLFEIGTLGSFVSKTLCAPPDPDKFAEAVLKLRKRADELIGWIYEAKNSSNVPGTIRHIIWSDVLVCPKCKKEKSYWDAAVRRTPFSMSDLFECTFCKHTCKIGSCERAVETVEDHFGGNIERKKRKPVRVYGTTGKEKWARAPSGEDLALIERIQKIPMPPSAPNKDIVWGDLHRTGYHKGIEKLHHFYTRRNFLVVATLWSLIEECDESLREALRLLVLSYNSSHSTLMARVVVKKGQSDFVLTGSQSGVLYVSGLPVEKNVFEGIVRKSKSFVEAFRLIHGSRSEVFVHNTTSERIDLPSGSVDYVFTDPPFGGYIPYAEINQINELWLGTTTNRDDEIIISPAQDKSVEKYGQMMGNVFCEISRVLKPDGLATIVFHSAHSEVWRVLAAAYTGAGLSVKATSVLDKIQASFKQVVSKVSVKGDPLLLLSKGGSANAVVGKFVEIADEIVMKSLELGQEECDPQRLYSRFVTRCLELGIDVGMSAKDFYARARGILGVSE